MMSMFSLDNYFKERQIWTALIAMLLLKFLQLKSSWAWSVVPDPGSFGHGVIFFDRMRGQVLSRRGLVGFVEGYTWLHENPNEVVGAGKSTLLCALTGLLKPASGVARLIETTMVRLTEMKMTGSMFFLVAFFLCMGRMKRIH